MPVTIRNFGFFCGSTPRSAETLVRKKPVQVRGCRPDDGPQVAGQEIEKVDGLDFVVYRTGGDGIGLAPVGAHGVQGRVGPKPAQNQTQRQTDPHRRRASGILSMNHNALLREVCLVYGLPRRVVPS